MQLSPETEAVRLELLQGDGAAGCGAPQSEEIIDDLLQLLLRQPLLLHTSKLPHGAHVAVIIMHGAFTRAYSWKADRSSSWSRCPSCLESILLKAVSMSASEKLPSCKIPTRVCELYWFVKLCD